MKLYDLGGVAAFLFLVAIGTNIESKNSADEYAKNYKIVLIRNQEIRTANDALIVDNKNLADVIYEYKIREQMDNSRKVMVAPGFEIGVSKKGFEDDDDKTKRLTREGLPTEYPEKKEGTVNLRDDIKIRLVPKIE